MQVLQSAADQQRPEVEERMVRLYKMGRAGYWRLLLDVNSLRDVGRAYRTAAALARIDRDRVEEHRRTLASLNSERATLQARVKRSRARERRARDTQRGRRRRGLGARRARQADRREARSQRAADRRAAGRAAEAPNLGGAARRRERDVAAATLPIRPFRGALPWPADGVVSSTFGRVRGNSLGAADAHGIQLSLPEGEPVHAVYEGLVAFAGEFSGYGNLVILDHGDKAYSLYGHLAEAWPSRKAIGSMASARSGWPGGARPATRPFTLSCASTAPPSTRYNG